MKSRYLLIAALFISLTATCGNVPGFQGKRFIVKYDCGIMHPLLMGSTGKLPELYHNLTLDHTVSRAWTVGVKYGFMTYMATPNKRIFYGGSSYYGAEDGINPENFKGRYTQHIVGFVAKHYYKRKGFIAPVGRYIALGVYYQHTRQHITTVAKEYVGSSNYTYSVKGNNITTHWVGISFGMGRTFVAVKRMVIDVGFNLNIAPWPAYIVDGEFTPKRGAYRDLMLRNIFQVHLGLGALAF